jgi:hypothetical protein
MSVVKSGRRLWRTEDGSLVEDGHPDAMQLAYGPDDEVSEDDQKRLKGEQVEDAGEPDNTIDQGPFLAQHPTGTIVIRDPRSKSPAPDADPTEGVTYLGGPHAEGADEGEEDEQPAGGPANAPKGAARPNDKSAKTPANKGA